MMDDWFDEFLLSLQPEDPDVEFSHYEFTRQTRADTRKVEEESRRIKQEPGVQQPQAAATEAVQQEGGDPAPEPIKHPEGQEGQEVVVKQEGGAAREGEEQMEEGGESPVVIVLDSDEEDSFDEAGFKSLNLTLAGVSQDDDSDSLRGHGLRHPATSDLLVNRQGVKLEAKKEIPQILGYLCTRSVGRVYSPPGYLTGGISQKALRAPFIKAYQDGRYWGWSGHLKLATYPAADTKSCTHQATREHLHHLYQVAHFMGQVADAPDQDQYDLSIHQEIAQVRHIVYIQGSLRFSARFWCS